MDFVRELARLGVDASVAYDRQDLEERLWLSLERLSRPDTIICVTGEFKKGKSSLVNALIGEPLCPVDDDLATSAISVLRYGEEPEITVRRQEDNETVVEQIRTDQLVDFVTEGGNPENRRHVELVEINTPNAFLERGITLVDTPGSGTLAAGYGAATLAFLQTADALIFITDASQEFTAPEVEYLKAASERCSAVLIVMSKIDLYPAWRRILEINQGHLRDAGIQGEIIPVSAMLRDLALSSRDRQMNDESGIPRLLEAVKSQILDLAERRAALSALRNVRNAAEQMAATYRSEISILEDPEGAGEALTRLEEAKERVNHLRSAGSRWATVMNDGFTALAANVDYQFRSNVRAIQRAIEDEIESMNPAAQWDQITERLQRDVARTVEGAFNTIDDDVGKLRDTIFTLLQDETDELAHLTTDDVQINVYNMWVERELETTSSVQKVFKGLNAMRGSYMGLLMVGMLGNFVGLAAIGPVLLGAGVLFGGRQFMEERKRDVTRRRQQARTFVRQYIDDVQFEVGTRIRETTRDFQREMRDYFTDRIGELVRTYTEAIQGTQKSLQQDQQSREARLKDLKTRAEKLQELLRRVEIAESRL